MRQGNDRQQRKYATSYEERQQHEAAHFDDVAAQWSDAELVVRRDPQLGRKLFQRLGLDGELAGKRVLDCGCGPGTMAVSLALNGATVTAIDVSPASVALALRRAAVNCVEDRVQARVMNLERLELPDEQFDLVVGSMILHHVDVESAGREIRRVLKRGGYATFEENSASNPLLMLARAVFPGRMGIPKHSDGLEYPLTNQEIELLDQIFEGRCRRLFRDFLFFRLVDGYVFRGRSAVMSRLMLTLDQAAYRLLPGVRKYSYYQVLVMQRP